jgi:plasmid stabilization system protein ParE
MNVRYRERALADLDDISRYLATRSPTGAPNVLDAIRAAVVDIAEHPLSARPTSDPANSNENCTALPLQDILQCRG